MPRMMSFFLFGCASKLGCPCADRAVTLPAVRRTQQSLQTLGYRCKCHRHRTRCAERLCAVLGAVDLVHDQKCSTSISSGTNSASVSTVITSLAYPAQPPLRRCRRDWRPRRWGCSVCSGSARMRRRGPGCKSSAERWFAQTVSCSAATTSPSRWIRPSSAAAARSHGGSLCGNKWGCDRRGTTRARPAWPRRAPDPTSTTASTSCSSSPVSRSPTAHPGRTPMAIGSTATSPNSCSCDTTGSCCFPHRHPGVHLLSAVHKVASLLK